MFLGLFFNGSFCNNLAMYSHRRDIMMTPWDFHLKAKIRWKPYRATPSVTASIHADPVSLHVGPQNILAALQLYQTFGNYLLVSIELLACDLHLLDFLSANFFNHAVFVLGFRGV